MTKKSNEKDDLRTQEIQEALVVFTSALEEAFRTYYGAAFDAFLEKEWIAYLQSENQRAEDNAKKFKLKF